MPILSTREDSWGLGLKIIFYRPLTLFEKLYCSFCFQSKLRYTVTWLCLFYVASHLAKCQFLGLNFEISDKFFGKIMTNCLLIGWSKNQLQESVIGIILYCIITPFTVHLHVYLFTYLHNRVVALVRGESHNGLMSKESYTQRMSRGSWRPFWNIIHTHGLVLQAHTFELDIRASVSKISFHQLWIGNQLPSGPPPHLSLKAAILFCQPHVAPVPLDLMSGKWWWRASTMPYMLAILPPGQKIPSPSNTKIVSYNDFNLNMWMFFYRLSFNFEATAWVEFS